MKMSIKDRLLIACFTTLHYCTMVSVLSNQPSVPWPSKAMQPISLASRFMRVENSMPTDWAT